MKFEFNYPYLQFFLFSASPFVIELLSTLIKWYHAWICYFAPSSEITKITMCCDTTPLDGGWEELIWLARIEVECDTPSYNVCTSWVWNLNPNWICLCLVRLWLDQSVFFVEKEVVATGFIWLERETASSLWTMAAAEEVRVDAPSSGSFIKAGHFLIKGGEKSQF